MDRFIFTLFRSVALVFYLVSIILAGLMLLIVFRSFLGISQFGDPIVYLIAITLPVLPATVAFSLDRMARIGTKAGAQSD